MVGAGRLTCCCSICVMPGMDGIELLRRIREQKSMTELPIINGHGRDSSGDVVKRSG